jgi:ATP-dependent helicase/nuclease subunit A
MIPNDKKEVKSFEKLLEESKQIETTMSVIEEVKLAKNILDSADILNEKYASGIHLPTIQTPSQIKKRYEHLISENEVTVTSHQMSSKFEFLNENKKVSSTEIGSAVHELMQLLDFSNVSRETLNQTIEQLSVRNEVKRKINSHQILSLFDTKFGQLMVTKFEKMSREVPFSMLKTDENSGEQYVIRGIIDGFIKLDEKIMLFDYKTDFFSNLEAISKIKKRYQIQMNLYAESLMMAFDVKTIEKYLILLGGPDKVYIEQI